MIVENGKHYLYRHIRLDTNEVFYIGIGTKSKREYKTPVSIYYRAYKKQGKNVIWNRITSKTKYRVEIILESNNYNFVKKKEKEFIKLYGKKKYYGSLCNITDGGDGTCGAEKPKSKNSKFSKNIYQFDLNGKLIKKWNCGKDIERELGYYSQSIYDCCNNKKKNRTAYGFQWSYKNKNMPKTKANDKGQGIKIYQYTKKLKYVRSYPSALEASKKLGKTPVSITNCANGKNHNKTAHGFVWTKHKLSKEEIKIMIKKVNTYNKTI